MFVRRIKTTTFIEPMITPPLKLNKDECVLLISFASNDAASQYEKIVNSLTPYGFRVLEELGSSVLVSVIVDNPSDLASILIEFLERKDSIFVFSNSDGGLNVSTIFHRADSDDEVRSRADFWRPPWME